MKEGGREEDRERFREGGSETMVDKGRQRETYSPAQ